MIKKFIILGERCSGTNYIQNLILKNFEIDISYSVEKHFFNKEAILNANSNDILFIGIIRNIYSWINSLYKYPYHVSKSLRNNSLKFLNSEFKSFNNNKEIVNSRNIYTNAPYKNIFELRKVKMKFLIDDMPTLVQNYHLIKYEDLRNSFTLILNLIKDKFNLIPKVNYPENIDNYIGRGRRKGKFNNFKIDKNMQLSKREVFLHEDFDTFYEIKINYFFLTKDEFCSCGYLKDKDKTHCCLTCSIGKGHGPKCLKIKL